MRHARRLIVLLLTSAAVLLLLALALPWVLPMPERQPPPARSPFANGAMHEACGTRFHLRHWTPEAEVRGRVLLLHGFAGSTHSWRHTGPALAAAGYEALAVDLPPYGYGARTPPEGSLSACVAALASDRFGDAPFVAVGHSMGASVAARVAQAAGPRAAGLVLVGGGLGTGTGGGGWASRAIGVAPLARWAEVVAHYRMLSPERLASTLGSAYGRAPDPEELAGYRRPLLLAGTAPAVLGARRPDVPLDLARLPAPVQLIWGAGDSWVPPSVGERMLARLPDARLAVIEDAAHNPMETHPEAFQRLLSVYLDARLGCAGQPPTLATYAYGDHDRAAALEPLRELLTTATGQPWQVHLADDPTALAGSLGQGCVDVAVVNLGAYLLALDAQPALVHLPRVAVPAADADGYRAVLVARSEATTAQSPLRLALALPDSASGGLVPMIGMAALGHDATDAAQVSIRFLGRHEASLAAVRAGDADLAGIPEGLLRRSGAEDVVVRWRSEPIPVPPLLCRDTGRVDCAAIAAALLDAGATDAARALARAWPEFGAASAFEPADVADYRAIGTARAALLDRH